MAQSREDLIDERYAFTHATSKIGVSRYPTTPGQCIQMINADNLWSMPVSAQTEVLSTAKEFEQTVLRPALGVQRCGLAYNGFDRIQLTPFHGLSAEWQSISSGQCERGTDFPGWLWTRDSVHADKAELDKLRDAFRAKTGITADDTTFLGEDSDDNLFARLIRGEIPSWRPWEDGTHVASLSPFSNVLGAAVVIPRKHLPSDILSLAKNDFAQLMDAARHTAGLMREVYGCERVAMFFEGFEIDYTHVKLYPIFNKTPGSRPVQGPSDEFHDTYPGYMTTRLGPAATAETLRETIDKLSAVHAIP